MDNCSVTTPMCNGFMHQSFEIPAPPHSGLSGGLGGLSPQMHPILIPRKAGNSLEVTVFTFPTREISGAVTAQVLFLF